MRLPSRQALAVLCALATLCALAAAQGAQAQAIGAAPAITGDAVESVLPPGPPPRAPSLSDPNSRTGEAANEPGPRSGIPKSLRSSGSSAGGPANDLNDGGVPEEAAAPREAIAPKGALSNVLLGTELFHGNYCGTGQRGEGLPPTDDLDAACMHHDVCYDTAGYRSCACDLTLKREAGAVSERPEVATEIRRRALSVVEAAEAMGCRAP